MSTASGSFLRNTKPQWRAFTRLFDRIMVQGHMICLDGATGTSLQQKGVGGEKQWKGWPAQIYMPDAVHEVHEEYVQAGAEIIITNSYASNKHVMPPGTTDADVINANRMSAVLALDATKKHKDIFVAGSISNHAPNPPEGIIPSDSTNITELGCWPDPEEEIYNYKLQAETLAEGGVDFIFLEMLKDRTHAIRALEAASTVGLPVFVGLTMDDDKPVLRDDPSVKLEDAIAEFQEFDHVAGFNIMHSSLAVTVEATARARSVWDGIIGAYPNQGIYRYPNYDVEVPISVDEFVEYCARFENAGANMLGGCCGFDKKYIESLAAYIREKNMSLDVAV